MSASNTSEDPVPTEPPAAATAPLLPPRDGIEYLRHQVEGIRWMLAREAVDAEVCRGGILGDDMGLGKTFQTIGLLRNSPFVDFRTLLVCPPALVAGWLAELTACGYEVAQIASGSPVWTAVSDEARAEGRVVWLTTYPKMCLYARFLAEAEPAWGRVVLDEGHAIRNGKGTSRWLRAMAVAKRAACRWILSATPVQNGYADWRNLCWWLRVRAGASRIPDLGPLLMLRRTMAELRGDIEALPPAPRYVFHDLSIPEGSKEGELFRVLCNNLQNAMDDRAVGALMVLELYMRIQQFLVHPQLYVEGMRAKFRGAYPRPDWSGGATKWGAVMAELEEAVEERVPTIVFCQFAAEMDRVCAQADGMGARVFCIRGGMGVEKVGEAVEEARAAALAGTEGVVVVVQIVAGGAGLNLQFCRRVLFMSQHWNPAVVHQAVGRAVRIGQRGVVDIHFFRVVDDVMMNLDRRVVAVHLRKISGAKEICTSLYEGYAPVKGPSEGGDFVWSYPAAEAPAGDPV